MTLVCNTTTSRFLLRMGLVATVAAVGPVVACSSSTPPATVTPLTDAGTPSDAGLSVLPSTARVLTCDSAQFTQTGGASGGTWSVAPATGAGSIAVAGLFTAPTATPANPNVTVSYTAGAAVGSAGVTLGTAFVGAPASVAIGSNGFAVPHNPFEKIFSASGNQVYAGVMGPAAATGASEEVDVYASSDDGKTFGSPTAYHTGDLACATVVADPGNPSVVYLVYLAGHGDSTSNTGGTLRLAVSTDAAKTFPTEYVLVDSYNSLASYICPDVVAPSAGHIVTAGVAGAGGQSTWIATFQSGSSGTTVGPVGVESQFVDAGTDPFVAASETNSASATTCAIDSDGSGGSPRIVANANGEACVIFQHIEDPSCGALSGAVMVQCSTNSGVTWTTPASVGMNTVANTYPTGAVSPGGNVAVVYTQPVVEASGTNNETFVVISKDGGHTWSPPVQYPTASWLAVAGADPASGLAQQALHWEGDSILWMSATLVVGNAPVVVVDKTCDFGTTWSGAVTAGPYAAAGILATGSGIATGAILPSNAQNGPALSLVPLSP